MASQSMEEATRRAISCFDRYSDRFGRIYGLKGENFDRGAPFPSRDSEAIFPRHLEDRGVRVSPRRRAFGAFSRLPVGTFALYLVRLEPWQPDLELVATVALGDHAHLGASALTTALVDPERRVGLGAWYEVSATFAGPQTSWDHGFYAKASDPHRKRLDCIWRRHCDLCRRVPPRLRGDTLLTGLWERILARNSF